MNYLIISLFNHFFTSFSKLEQFFNDKKYKRAKDDTKNGAVSLSKLLFLLLLLYKVVQIFHLNIPSNKLLVIMHLKSNLLPDLL